MQNNLYIHLGVNMIDNYCNVYPGKNEIYSRA
jgi:hypothetical protein